MKTVQTIEMTQIIDMMTYDLVTHFLQ